MSAPVQIQERAVVSRRHSYYVRHAGMPDKIQGKSEALATASGITAMKKISNVEKDDPAGRQAGRSKR